MQPEAVERVALIAENSAQSIENLILKHAGIELNQRGMLVSDLQAARIVGNREAIGRVGQNTAEDELGIGRLRLEDIDRPDRIVGLIAELHEEHLPADEAVDAALAPHPIVTTSIGDMLVGAFLDLAGDRHVGGKPVVKMPSSAMASR